MTRVALYCRCSTLMQSTDLQVSELRKYAADRKMEIVGEYIDNGISGSKDSRPELNRLMADAWKRKFDAVLVFRFDRFARSVKHLVTALEAFEELKISFNEQFDTSTSIGKALVAIIGALGQLERDIIRERVTAGVRKAREKRGTWGRPRIDFVDPGGSVRHAMEITGVSRETVRRNRLKAGYRYVQVEVPDPTPPEQP